MEKLFFNQKSGVWLVKTDENEKKKKNENLLKRGSIYDHFYMGDLAWGATWDPFLRKMFGFGKNWVPEFPKFYEKWSEMDLESTDFDENKWKWIGIAWLSLLD